MLAQIQATISRHQMLASGDEVIVAVSGGFDSVCLLHALLDLAPQAGFTVTGVAHFNHKLRGEASDQDERFVADMSASLGLTFHGRAAEPGELSGNLEQSARRARRRFFADLVHRAATDGHAGTRVALGHTKDDQAETVLFRLLRGSGPGGLAGILPVADEYLVRPLLDVSRTQVLEFLGQRGVLARQDETNLQLNFARNRIRHSLLPQLAQDWNPNISDAFAHLADVAYEEEHWWAAEVDRQLESHAGTIHVASGCVIELPVEILANQPKALARRMVRELIKRVKGGLDGIQYQHVESILAMLDCCSENNRIGHASATLPGVDIARSFEWLRIAKPKPRAGMDARHVEVPGEYPTVDGNSLIQLTLVGQDQPSGACATLRLQDSESLQLRGWLPGDRYQPVSSARPRSLKEMFQVARVPSWRRSSWPILTSDGKILWAKGFGPAAQVAAEDRRGIQIVVKEVSRGRCAESDS